ncbi:very short patch repair endonuclease [Streptomyces sp. NPDC008159]|uniref:very short patch repair endonuclease n=1 Tax=Streptomyces sp. NPDC008159 TaxID=3364817 RepID=UPI0036EA22A0
MTSPPKAPGPSPAPLDDQAADGRCEQQGERRPPSGGGGAAGRWVKTEKGEHLKGRRARDTAPEVALRRALHRLGFRFRLQRRVAPRCTADFVLPKHHLAVFVDGCFWHGCPEHGAREFRGPNASRWAEKIQTNQARDRRNDQAARESGWQVIRIWECEIRKDPEAAAQRVAEATRVGTANPPIASDTV